ncbi:MAG: hypothetical protein UR60_C0043G0022 [Candidatus Moranbacteria bacterium GW2011_GWF2_34_56]|nr:MAG: hypothetical protein UR51_C0002G0053 [Candidatus Moranbacteria bacterium GW2011_GWF1_34_10]KKP63512.1 MAG: hypothetical protein UR60_C0043G0022 [Candidatus Moranbacteria bacterium GW2011_GWF2_34_56]HBI17476.1 ATPase [Candidatus Moranbacteria bacterium]
MKNISNNKKGELIINRIFNAPIERVWEAWTNPEIFKKWWGPKDFTAPYAEVDFRVGGKSLACMKAPDGKEYWSTGTYKEIIPYKKIVTTDSFSDKEGNIVSAKEYGMEDIPEELEIEVNFKKLENRKTDMTLKHGKFPEGSIIKSAQQGWSQSFDKFEEILK